MSNFRRPEVMVVAPGVHRFAVPIASSSLGHVFVYAFRGDDGVYVIDTGWPQQESYEAFVTGLEALGHRLEELRGILITHVHPDHYGLAGRLRQETGAWVALHSADTELMRSGFGRPDVMRPHQERMLERAGAPGDEREAMVSTPSSALSPEWMVEPDVVLHDGDDAGIPGWDLEVVWTPGHSPGHACFYAREADLLFTGDHVLSRISPNIPFHPWVSQDPLGDYLRSLSRIGGLEVRVGHPAHQETIRDVPARVLQLRAHHRDRCDDILRIVERGSNTGYSVARMLSWSRPWSTMPPKSQRMAIGETMAHLVALCELGSLDEVSGAGSAPSRFFLRS